LKVSRFPDGETLVRIPAKLMGRSVVIVNSSYPAANDALMEMALAVDAARRGGALSVTAVLPYLAYMRQDTVFNPGEPLSASVMARVLDDADRVIAVDPHLHRIRQLSDVFKTRAESVTANSTLAEYIQAQYRTVVVVGPDAESFQWARSIADSIGFQSAILRKTRFSASRVAVRLQGAVSVKGRDVVIVDDMVSTGHTVAEAAKLAKRLGARRVHCVCVHGLFLGDAVKLLRRAGVKDIVSTNTVPGPFARIDVSSVIADAL
jgi:ribose-phosphate pyrophosphokinase